VTEQYSPRVSKLPNCSQRSSFYFGYSYHLLPNPLEIVEQCLTKGYIRLALITALPGHVINVHGFKMRFWVIRACFIVD